MTWQEKFEREHQGTELTLVLERRMNGLLPPLSMLAQAWYLAF